MWRSYGVQSPFAGRVTRGFPLGFATTSAAPPTDVAAQPEDPRTPVRSPIRDPRRTGPPGPRARGTGPDPDQAQHRQPDRKSTRLNPVTNAHLVCRLLLEKKKK